MKNIIIVIVFLFSVQKGIGQIIPSSCTAPDSIVAKYTSDADRLALQTLFHNNLTYTDSVKIPQEFADSMLNALIAVYNAIGLPARDTVINLYTIHTIPIPDMNSVSVSADSNLAWMHNLKNNVIPSGNQTIDSLMTLYNLHVGEYSMHSGHFQYHTVVFQSDSNYNTLALSGIFETIPGVFFSDPLELFGDGNDITAFVFSDHIELIYSVGWGDCLCGCIWRRYWKFTIYYDCSVEFVGSYGSSLPVSVISDRNTTSITIYPNPFQDALFINGLSQEYEYILFDILGQKLLQGQTSEKTLTNLNRLPAGHYFLLIKIDQYRETRKLIKK